MRIILTGATGFIGKKLALELHNRGHQLVIISRDSEKARRTLGDKYEYSTWSAGVLKADAAVNLAGESISNRWSAKEKTRILNSRLEASRKLFEMVRESKPRVILSASAIGFYGDRGDAWLDEQSSAGEGFLSEVCQAWEKITLGTSMPGTRLAALRLGIVLGRDGGMLAKTLPIFKAGLGGKAGSGRQWMSWIHVDDLIRLFVEVLENDQFAGVVNAVAPNPVTNAEFTNALSTALHRPALLPLPTPVAKIALGEMSHLLLDSQRVRSTKLDRFSFQYKNLSSALKSILE